MESGAGGRLEDEADMAGAMRRSQGVDVPSRLSRRVSRRSLLVVIVLLGLVIAVDAIVAALSGPPFLSFPFGGFWFLLLLEVLLVASVVTGWGIRFTARAGILGHLPPHNMADGVKEILRHRYESGEIGKDEFDRLMRDLDRRP